MKIIKTISALNEIKSGCVLSIGNFDGVHLGHKEILRTAKKIADQRQAPLVVMTFEPHPVAILYPEKSPGVLTPLSFKIKLISDCGADYLVVLTDSRELLALSPREFVENFLVKYIQPGTVVEGENFNFGSKRAGSIDTLKTLAAEMGFEVEVVKPKSIDLSSKDSDRVSSTLIRKLLEVGKVSDAALGLSRPYKIAGKIIPGRGVGKQLGFPTLNMQQPGQIIPAEGVYAGFVQMGQNLEDAFFTKEQFPAALSIGKSPTYSGELPLAIEAHLLVEDVEDLAGEYIAMDFIKQVRGQKKFPSHADLAEQIKKDCQAIMQILKIS
jgi:riboflavin kinase/FMN adenylyltransferase